MVSLTVLNQTVPKLVELYPLTHYVTFYDYSNGCLTDGGCSLYNNAYTCGQSIIIPSRLFLSCEGKDVIINNTIAIILLHFYLIQLLGYLHAGVVTISPSGIVDHFVMGNN